MTIRFLVDCANEEALQKDPMPLNDLSVTTVQTGTTTKSSIKEMKEKTIKIDFFASPDDISVCKIHAVIPQQWQANNLVEIKSNNNKTLKTIDIRTWKPETHQKNFMPTKCQCTKNLTKFLVYCSLFYQNE